MSGMYCEVCGKQLSVWTKNRICSDRCRAKRSRDKREAKRRAHDVGTTVTGWGKLLSHGVITPDEAEDLVHIIWETLGPLHRQIQAAKGKAEEAEA